MSVEKGELRQKIEEHLGVSILRNIIGNGNQDTRRYNHPLLAGGAIVDILDDREPKDYDIINGDHLIDMFEESGFEFVSDSKTAATYKRNDMTVQFLKIGLSQFEYRISQSTYNFIIREVELDMRSWKNKTLIPVSYGDYFAANCLRRIPHWNRKGYSMPDVTYFSLLETATKSKTTARNNYDYGS